MDNDTPQTLPLIVGAIVRHAVGALGAVLMTKGVIASSMLEPFTGACMTTAAILWSLYQKKQHKDTVVAAQQATATAEMRASSGSDTTDPVPESRLPR